MPPPRTGMIMVKSMTDGFERNLPLTPSLPLPASGEREGPAQHHDDDAHE